MICKRTPPRLRLSECRAAASNVLPESNHMPTPQFSVRSILGSLPAHRDSAGHSAIFRPAEGNVKPEASPPAADAATKPDVPPAASTTPPGHSMHGEAFNEGPRQKAYLMGGTGKVHMPMSTRIPEAQQFFDQGVWASCTASGTSRPNDRFARWLRSTPIVPWPTGAWRWPTPTTTNGPRSFIEKANGRRTMRAARDRLDRCPGSHVRRSDTRSGRQKYVRDLEELVQDDPNDVEAKALLALQIWKNGSWMTEDKKQLRSPATRRSIRCWTRSSPSSRCTRPITTAFTCGMRRRRSGRWWLGRAVRAVVAGHRPHVAHAGAHLLEAAPLCRRGLAAGSVGPRRSRPHDARPACCPIRFTTSPTTTNG